MREENPSTCLTAATGVREATRGADDGVRRGDYRGALSRGAAIGEADDDGTRERSVVHELAPVVRF